jgi:hypothetical protein
VGGGPEPGHADVELLASLICAGLARASGRESEAAGRGLEDGFNTLSVVSVVDIAVLLEEVEIGFEAASHGVHKGSSSVPADGVAAALGVHRGLIAGAVEVIVTHGEASQAVGATVLDASKLEEGLQVLGILGSWVGKEPQFGKDLLEASVLAENVEVVDEAVNIDLGSLGLVVVVGASARVHRISKKALAFFTSSAETLAWNKG